MDEAGADVVAIPRPDHLFAGNGAAVLFIGHHIGHDLAGMGTLGEAVDDTYQDLSVYAVIAQLVKNGKWGK